MRVKCWICGGKGHIPVYELFCAASETARACTNCGGKGIIDLEIIEESTQTTIKENRGSGPSNATSFRQCDGCPHDHYCGCGLGYDDVTCCPHNK